MKPERYFTLIDIDSDEIRAVFAADHLSDAAEMVAFEQDLRREYAVDAIGSGLALWDSDDRPLRDEVWRDIQWKQGSGGQGA